MLDYATDFDAPRFESGMDYHILYHVGCYFNLHAYTVQAVASMPPKVSKKERCIGTSIALISDRLHLTL